MNAFFCLHIHIQLSIENFSSFLYFQFQKERNKNFDHYFEIYWMRHEGIKEEEEKDKVVMMLNVNNVDRRKFLTL